MAYYVKNEDAEGVKLNYPSVSIIIVAKNESENLEKNLPSILTQDYPNFEVIVVNDGSTDESDVLLKRLEQDNAHLYHTFSPVLRDRAFGRRKLALTIGIKAAKNDVLLFTEADCAPISNQWISTMMAPLTEDKDIVIGYCFQEKEKGFFRRLARFDNLLFSLQYLSKAIRGKAFAGVYRNIAYRKHLFFDNKGFSSCLNIENGEEVFLHQIIRTQESAVSLSPDSFVSMPIETFSKWRQIKMSYMRAKSHFSGWDKSFFSLETLTRYLFYIVFGGTLAYAIIGQEWGSVAVIALIFIIRLITQLVVLSKATKHFKSTKIYFSILILDILQPIYNLYFKVASKSARKSRY